MNFIDKDERIFYDHYESSLVYKIMPHVPMIL